MDMRIYIFSAMLMVLSVFSESTLASQGHPELASEFVQRHSQLRFQRVLIQNQNSQVGLQFETTLELINWSQLPLQQLEGSDTTWSTVLGLTPSGRLYQQIRVGQQNFARLLSGGRCIKEFRLLSQTQELVALSCDGKFLYYDPALWLQSPAKPIVVRRLKQSAVAATLITLTAFGLVYLDPLSNGGPPQPFMALVLAAFGTFAHSQIQIMFGLNEYDWANRHPDGFIQTAHSLNSLDDLKAEHLPGPGIDIRGHWQTDCAALLLTKPPEGSTYRYDEKLL